MLYKVDIANLALGRLGVSLTVSDFDTENSNQAKIIRRYFELSKRKVLRKHPWNVAQQDQALIASVSDPTDKNYSYEYTLPSNCLILNAIACNGIFPSVILYDEEKLKWREIYSPSGQTIWTNIRNAYGRYTVDLDQNIAFHDHLGDAIGAQLAMDIAPMLITQNYAKVKADLLGNAKNDIDLAIADDIARQPRMEDSPSPFVLARWRN